MSDSSRAFYADFLESYSHVAVPAANRTHAVQGWLSGACPFEETRHSCFFLSQPNADEVAMRAAQTAAALRSAAPPSKIERVLRMLDQKEIVFVGD